MKFDPRPCTIVLGLWLNFLATLKIHNNPILIEISSHFLYNISTCICIKTLMKNEFHFDEIWPETMYYITGTLERFMR